MTVTTTRSTFTKKAIQEHSAGFVLYAVGEGSKRHYLLLKHCNGGHWGFPKGKIESGEGEVQAALRETREESGIGAIDLVPDFRAVSAYRFFRGETLVSKEVVYFLGRVCQSDIVLSQEHIESRWLVYSAAQGTLTYAGARNVLRAAEEYLRRKQAARA